MFLRRFYSLSANLLKRKACLSQPMHKLTESPSPQANRVTLYLHQAQLIDSIRLSLRSNLTFHVDLLPSPIDSFVATHALRSAPSPDSALSLFHSLSALPNFSHTRNTIHAMAKILASAARLSDLQTLIRGIDSGEFPSAARPAPLDLLRWYAAAGDSKSVAQTWAQMKIDGQKRPCTESYNLIIGLHVKKGENSHAVQVFSQMITDGANPNSRTYTVLMEHLIAAGRMDAAMEVFERLSAMRIRRTSRQYSALAKGFMESGRLDVVAKLITEMRRDGILPGHNLQAVFVQLQATGFVKDTEDFIREFLPDERIGSLGFSVGSSDDDDASAEDDDDRDQDRGQIRLKPWLDPSALASTLSNWNPSEVSALESARLVWTRRLVCKLLRAFKRAETAWEFFCWVAYQPGGFTHDVYTVSRMIAILARSGHVDLVDSLLSKIKREGIRLSFSTVRLVVDLYGLSKKADAALRVFRELELICGAVSKSDRRLLYSSLLRTFIKCKRSSVAMDLVEEMVLSGLIPDIQTYSGLMQHFALQGDLRTVHQLFGMVRQSELEPDAYMYQMLIRAYCKRERAALALRIFEDMRGADLWPDAATKALLVKCLWKEGKLREAAAVEEKGEEVRDLLPVALPGHVWTGIHHHLPETRGLCLSEERTVSTILRRPIFGFGNRVVEMMTDPYKLILRCEVTAILVLYGLPRLLTGSILAHEMMHAWLWLNGYSTLRPEVEEGICRVLAHMWLDSEIFSGSESRIASSSSSSSSSTSSKMGTRSQFERKLGDFFKHQIQSDTSAAYGDGFSIGNEAVLRYGLRQTLDHIKLTGSFPY